MPSYSAWSIRSRSLLPLSAGLAVAQVIATVFVWRSNHELYQTLRALESAGWLAVPAGPAAANLKNFGAAFWGGLFFTLSIGVGLALATWAALFFWNWLHSLKQSSSPAARKLGRGLSIFWLIAILLLWGFAVYRVNANGPVLFPTLFLIAIPVATAAAAIRLSPARVRHRWLLPLAVLALLTGLFYSQLHPLDERLFIAIRDRLLLSNPIGMAVNDFYYRYTLYAAQTFKTFNQKESRACRITGMPEDDAYRRLVAVLAGHDVLTVREASPVDLVISAANGNLTLATPRADRIEVPTTVFLRDPGRWLGRFSEAGDRYAPFRRMTFLGLLLGFPIILFVLVDGFVGRIGAFGVRGLALTWARALICVFLGVLLLIPIWAGRPVEIRKDQIEPALASGQWSRRVAALRLIEKQKLEVTRYPQYRELLESRRPVERYYVARALAVSHNPQSFDDLLALIHDRQLNVVCQAYFALGERRDRRAAAPIERQIRQSNDWYTQWYGYRALKRLGWRQTPSK